MTAPADLLKNAGYRPELVTLGEHGESSFRHAEEFRQKVGFDTLKRLVALNKPEINQTLKNIIIPDGFDFDRDWLAPTGVHEFGTKPGQEIFIQGNKGEKIQIMGVRMQDNIVTKSLPQDQVKKAGIIPVGGGVRVSFVEAKNESDKVWTFSTPEKDKNRMIDEAGGLSGAMVPKNTAQNFRERLIDVLVKMKREDLIPMAEKISIGGGAKGDIIVALPKEIIELEKKGGDSKKLAEEMKKDLVTKALFAAGYQLTEMGAIGPETDRAAGDKNTTSTLGGRPVMEWLADGAIAYVHNAGEIPDENYIRSGVSGKGADGLSSRFYATGLGGWASTLAYAELNGIDVKGKKVMSRGVGSAVNKALIEAVKAGMIVNCIADASGIIVKDGSFTVGEIEELYQVSVEEKASIVDWARNKENMTLYYDPSPELPEKERFTQIAKKVTEFWQAEKPDFIFEAATQETLNENTAEFVPDGAVVTEFANGATTPLAAEILNKKNVQRIPGINSNGGGVFVSWFEWAQSILKVNFPPELVDQAVIQLMKDNMRETWELISAARENGITNVNQENVFYSLAIAKGLAERQRLEEIIRSNVN